ncbi:MAG: hypothetical protein ABI036_06960 [Fibrobacteria bacterium]
METFTGLLAKHLETFRELESLQVKALEGMKSNGLEGLAAMLARQQDVMSAIALEKSGLRPYLDQWEGLQSEMRAQLRAGRPGEILQALETVAQGIQARHAEMFGADEMSGLGNRSAPSAAGGAKPADGGIAKDPPSAPDLSQMINIYRAMQ